MEASLPRLLFQTACAHAHTFTPSRTQSQILHVYGCASVCGWPVRQSQCCSVSSSSQPPPFEAHPHTYTHGLHLPTTLKHARTPANGHRTQQSSFNKCKHKHTHTCTVRDGSEAFFQRSALSVWASAYPIPHFTIHTAESSALD